MQSELMDVMEIAAELHLSPAYVRNFWRSVLPGIRPRKTRAKQRKLLFFRNEVKGLISKLK